MAQTIVAVRFQEVDRFSQRLMQDEVVVGGEHHVRRGQLRNAVGQFGLHAPVGELRQVLVIDRRKITFRALGRRVQHQNLARQAAVILQRSTQKRRAVVGDQYHRQQLAQWQLLFRNRLALHNFSHDRRNRPKNALIMELINEPGADNRPTRR